MRRRYDFLTMATTPELAAEATLLPVSRLGVDGAVLFADIMLPLTGMGIPFRITPSVGPVVDEPVRDAASIDRLRVPVAAESTPYVLEALRLVRHELGERAALLGFAGAPFTLACYIVDGKPSREYPRTKALLYGQPRLWHRLMDRLTDMTIDYLQAQLAAGTDIVQVFDSWLGILDPPTYTSAVLPHMRRLAAAVRPHGPLISFSTGTATLLDLIAGAGADVISVDWRLPLDIAWQRIGDNHAIQGNLDPALLLAPFPMVATAARNILTKAAGRPGHIFNLGHGILPETDPDHLTRLVELVHTETTRRRS